MPTSNSVQAPQQQKHPSLHHPLPSPSLEADSVIMSTTSSTSGASQPASPIDMLDSSETSLPSSMSPHKPIAVTVPKKLLAHAKQLDAEDPLRNHRHQFNIPEQTVYLCGNSLGPQPIRTLKAIETHMHKWAMSAAEAHFEDPDPWVSIEDEASRLCMPVVGALHEHEVVVMNSLTVNLHLMLTAFYRPTGRRTAVLIEHHAFSSDDYALQSHLQSRGIDPGESLVRLRPRDGDVLLADDDIIKAIRELDDSGTLALVLLPGVQFYTGQVFPMERIARECNLRHVPFGLDLAHAVGNIPLSLHEWGVDFGVWCHYKYLNSGPGAIAGAFLHDRHSTKTSELHRLGGWWGHDRSSRFEMPEKFVPQRGARGFQLSNPPVLAVVPVKEALRLLSEVGGVDVTRRKSVKLTQFMRECLAMRLGKAVNVITPEGAQRSGAQLSVRIECGRHIGGTGVGVDEVNEGLRRYGVMCDVRRPDVIRVAPCPLFNSFQDVCVFVCALENVLLTLA